MTALFNEYDLIQQSALFDAEFYLKTYPDVAKLGVDPLLHYLESGWSEGREPSSTFVTAFYLQQCAQLGLNVENPLLHFVQHGKNLGLETFGIVNGADPKAAPDTRQHKAKRGKVPTFSGSIQRAELGSGFLFVEGSVQESPDSPHSGDLVLAANVDGVAIGKRSLSFLAEKDKAQSSADGAVRYFAVALPIKESSYNAISFTLSRRKERTLLLPHDLKPQIFKPRGQIERVDGSGIYGWVFDPACSLAKHKPTLLIDDKIELPLTLQEARLDLPYRDCDSDECRWGFHIPLQDLVRFARGHDHGFTLFSATGHTFALSTSGTLVHALIANLRPNYVGRLERCDVNGASGWAAIPGSPDASASIELFIDGVRYQTVNATQFRRDLKLKGVTNAGGGFQIDLPSVMGNASPQLTVSARFASSDIELPGSPQEVKAPRRSKDRRAILDQLNFAKAPITILIPIYDAVEDVALCIESVIQHTTVPARLLLIDDASPDPRIAELLRKWQGWANIEIHTNPENLGFTRTMNKGMKLAGEDDVVFLNSDTIVSPGWLEGLRIAAYSKPNVGTATAVSNNSGAFNVHELGTDNVIPPWLEVEDFGRLIRRASLSSYPNVPTGNGFCMYVRRSCIDKVGPLDEKAFPRGYGEENDFCMRALRAGFAHVVDDRTFVYHKRSASFGEQKNSLMSSGVDIVRQRYPEYSVLTSVFSDDPDFLAMRWRVRQAIRDAGKHGTIPRPRVLFVISTTTGGTPQTNRDLMDALSDRYEPWTLRCDSRVIELCRHEPAGPVSIETHRLDKVIPAGLHRSSEYDAQVADLLLRYGFETVHIRHVAWHGLGLVDACNKLGIPVIFSFHDFYTVCPTVKLLDENQVFCGGKCTATPGQCDAELWPKNSVPLLKNNFIHRWREMMSSALRQCDAFVTTSPGARDIVMANYPEIAGKEFRVIPHGRSFSEMATVTSPLAGNSPLRILVPGNISAAKGANFFEAAADLDIYGDIEFHILGDAGTLSPRRNLVLHGKYERHDFLKKVQAIRPHIGAVLSIWPETYCHTLTEMWACGLPVLAFDMGAVGERIRQHGGGWLIDRWTSPEALVEYLIKLKRDSNGIASKVTEIWAWQTEYGRHYDTKAMAVEYDLLYRDVRASKTPFRPSKEQISPSAKTVLVVSARDPISGKAPASTHIRLLERVRNKASRPIIFREVAADYPFDNVECGRAHGVLIQRNVIKPSAIPHFIEQCQKLGLPIVLDMDDDLLNVPADKDPDHRYANGANALRSLLSASKLLMVSTPALKTRMRDVAPQLALVPNMLSARLWQTDASSSEASQLALGSSANKNKLLVLYMGTATHDDDLEMIRDAFIPLVESGVCELHVIGGQSKDASWFQRIPLPNEVKNYPEFVAWFRSISASFDLAIAPLRDTDFNSCKSDLKFLDYSAAGLPAVLSDVPSYQWGAEAAILVKNTMEDWQRAILSMKDPETRIRLLHNARERVNASRMMRTGSEGFDELILSCI